MKLVRPPLRKHALLLILVFLLGCMSALGACRSGPVVSPAERLGTQLHGLSFDDFMRVSWKALYMRDPEQVVADGLAATFQLEGAQLTDISDNYRLDTYAMYQTVLENLERYDYAELSLDQQISYDVYSWYLRDRIDEKEFMYYDYPATFFSPTAVHLSLIEFFTNLHPLNSKQDARDYVERLGQVRRKLDQLIDGLRLRQREGIVPPRFAVEWALYSIAPLADATTKQTPFYTTFQTRLEALTQVDANEEGELLRAAESAIRKSVIPGYGDLARELRRQLDAAPDEDGVWQFGRGEDYYAYLLQHFTTTSLTATEIHQMGLDELARIQAELRLEFTALGYPADETLPELFDRVEDDGGYVPADQVLSTYETLVSRAKLRLGEAFDLLPRADVVVISSAMKGMYTPGSVDGSRPGAFHAGQGLQPEAYFAMPTLTYHETVPGHHLQIALAAESDLPMFRNMVTFLGYTEGWALYAERLAWELGWYKDDPYGNIGRLQAEAFRAARLVVDTGIHAKRWTRQQAVDFFTMATGFEEGDPVSPNEQIARYIVWPGQATAYEVGMLRLLELREKARQALGDRFDLKEFHRVVLTSGSMPLEVLERVVDRYVAEKKSE